MVEISLPCLRRVEKGQGEPVHIKSKVYLPSRTEFGWGNESGIAEGSVLELFRNSKRYRKACPTKEQMEIYGRSWNPGWDYGGRIKPAKLDAAQIYDPKYGRWYWYRTPHLTYAYLVRVQSTYGALSYMMAYNDIVGIRPVLNICGDAKLEKLEDGSYALI